MKACELPPRIRDGPRGLGALIELVLQEHPSIPSASRAPTHLQYAMPWPQPPGQWPLGMPGGGSNKTQTKSQPGVPRQASHIVLSVAWGSPATSASSAALRLQLVTDLPADVLVGRQTTNCSGYVGVPQPRLASPCSNARPSAASV